MWVRWRWDRQRTSGSCATRKRLPPGPARRGRIRSRPGYSPGRSLPTIEGADIRFVGGDLAGQFYDAGLLDELIIGVGSVTLGKGKPLFPRRVLSPVLRLAAVRRMGAGMVELRYEVQRGDPG